METDGYEDEEPREIYDRGIIDQRWIPSLIDGWHPGMGGVGGGGGAGNVFVGGGGGGGYMHHVFSTDHTSPLTPDLSQLIGREFQITVPKQPTEEEVQEMSWTNPEARDIAREILSEKKKEALRGEVTAAVATLTEMVADAKCGSVFTFRKTNEENGKHYWYAAIKNGDKWFTTAQSPRQLDNDEAFIEWLINLEAWKSEGLELTQGSIPEHRMLEATATDTTAGDA